jgi:hypothetical protein
LIGNLASGWKEIRSAVTVDSRTERRTNAPKIAAAKAVMLARMGKAKETVTLVTSAGAGVRATVGDY